MVKTLLSICRKYWLALILFLIGGISQTLIGLYSIVVFQQLLDGVTTAQQFADIIHVLFWYVGLTAVNHLLIYVEGYPNSILRNGTYQWVKLQAMKKIALPVIISCVVLVGTGVIMAIVFTRLGLVDIGTAYLGTSPGAMSALIVLALESQAQPMLVVCFHFIRVVFVILTAPLVFKLISGH